MSRGSVGLAIGRTLATALRKAEMVDGKLLNRRWVPWPFTYELVIPIRQKARSASDASRHVRLIGPGPFLQHRRHRIHIFVTCRADGKSHALPQLEGESDPQSPTVPLLTLLFPRGPKRVHILASRTKISKSRPSESRTNEPAAV